MTRWIGLGLLMMVSALPSPAWGCSICLGIQGQTLRQEAAQAKFVIFGTLTKPPGDEKDLSFTTNLSIEKVLKHHPILDDKKVLVLSRPLPFDPRNPQKILVFSDVWKGDDGKEKVDPYRGDFVKSAAVAEYLQGALALDPKDPDQLLSYYFNHLEHQESAIANDAFLELAKASDRDIGQAAGKFSPDKLRGWVQDEKIPSNRLNLYAFLLGACGGEKDAALLESLLKNPNDRANGAYAGLLSGYIHLRPREGWDFLHSVLRDDKKLPSQRMAAIFAMRLLHGWKPAETRREVLDGLKIAVEHGDVADLAVENLRQWQIWDLTGDVVAQFDKKSHDAPLIRRGIVRYALCCPRPEAANFLNHLRKQDPMLVKEVEESLQFEKQKP